MQIENQEDGSQVVLLGPKEIETFIAEGVQRTQQKYRLENLQLGEHRVEVSLQTYPDGSLSGGTVEIRPKSKES